MNLTVQRASLAPDQPDDATIHAWFAAACRHPAVSGHALLTRPYPPELTVRIVDEAESAQLNATWRHKDGPTNVLSFPADLPAEMPLAVLGDLAVCAPVVAREAREQHKSAQAHWAHILIHGFLHLLGYDHLTTTQAQQMEPIETEILAALHFPDPYM